MIEEFRRGEPDYQRMSPDLAKATRQQLPMLRAMFNGLGTIESVSFREVGPGGADVFDVTLAEGAVAFAVRLDTSGAASAAAVRPAQQ
jgi:hypothetical protein